MGRLPVLLAAAAVALAAVPSALAHATLVRSVPADRSVVAHAPAAVRLVFDDDVRPGPGIEAVRNGGGSVLGGAARVAGARTLVVPLRRGLADGDYSVRWAVVSDDGHLVSGVVAFAVGAGARPPTATLAPEATGPDAASVVSRWLLFAGLLTAAGTALFWLLAWRPAAGELGGERLTLLVVSGCVVFVVGASDGLHGASTATRYGASLLAGVVAALVAASVAAAGLLDRRLALPGALLSLGLVAVPSVGGHALDPGVPWGNVVADVLHVTAAAAWAGVVVGLVVVLPVAGDAAREVARRASTLALGAVVAVGATGIVRASFELTRASQLWTTGYGRSLLVKTVLALALVALGWLNRARLLALVALRRNVRVELALLVLLVGAVAVLVQLRPGRNAVRVAAAAPVAIPTASSPEPPAPPRGAVLLAREAGPLGVALAVEPARLTATVLSPAGGGFSGLDVSFLVDGRSVDATPCGSGCYTAAASRPRHVTVRIRDFPSASFVVPERALDATRLVRRARARYRALRTVVYRERLASSPENALVTIWRLQAPNRFAYAVPGGTSAVIVGARRWDRASPRARWIASPQVPLRQPATYWTRAVDAHVVAQTPTTVTVTFADPSIPAWFRLRLRRATLLPTDLWMTAAAHFMHDRYLALNAALEIRPPTAR